MQCHIDGVAFRSGAMLCEQVHNSRLALIEFAAFDLDGLPGPRIPQAQKLIEEIGLDFSWYDERQQERV